MAIENEIKRFPERQRRILSVLADNLSGLSSQEILNKIADRFDNKFTSDAHLAGASNVGSQICFLRGQRLVTSDKQQSPNVHMITRDGMVIAKLFPPGDASDPVSRAVEHQVNEIVQKPELTVQSQQSEPIPDSDHDILKPDFAHDQKIAMLLLDVHHEIGSCLSALHNELRPLLKKPLVIDDKTLKMDVLNKLAPLVNDEISQVLMAVRDDLERLGCD